MRNLTRATALAGSVLMLMSLGSLISPATAAKQSVPTVQMQQISRTTANVTVSSSGGSKWRVIVVDDSDATVYDSTSKSKSHTVPIAATGETTYTFTGCSVVSSKQLCSKPAVFVTRPAQVPVTFATWNVCSTSSSCPNLAAWSSRSRSVAAQVKASGTDVFTAQQLGSSKEVSALDSALGSSWTRAAGAKSRYLYFNEATISDESWSGSSLPGGSDHVQARKKVSKDTYYAWHLLRNKATNSLFVAVGLHLTPYDGVVPDQDRLAEAQQTYAKVKSAVLAKYPGVPLVLSGDLNSLLRRHLDGCDSDLERYRVSDYLTTLGLGDARLRAEQVVNGDESSYVRNPSDPRDLCAQFQLDHIYTSISTRVIGWKLWVQPFTDYGTRFSDHEMVSSTLALPSF